ncbi:hypothetical protein IAG25_39060 [Caballeronia sp. EK]|nr:hypothetical protein [Caballeronia sp. EK]
MNHTYRLVWNEVRQAWVAAVEFARVRSMSCKRTAKVRRGTALALLPTIQKVALAQTSGQGGTTFLAIYAAPLTSNSCCVSLEPGPPSTAAPSPTWLWCGGASWPVLHRLAGSDPRLYAFAQTDSLRRTRRSFFNSPELRRA